MIPQRPSPGRALTSKEDEPRRESTLLHVTTGSRHTFKQALMTTQDALSRRGIRLERPLPTLVGPAQDDPVLAWHHVELTRTDREVVHLPLRREHGELPFDRQHLGVVKECSRSQAGAVHNQGLRQCFNPLRIGEVPHDEAPAGEAVVREDGREVGRGLNVHGERPGHVPRPEGVVPGREGHVRRSEVGNERRLRRRPTAHGSGDNVPTMAKEVYESSVVRPRSPQDFFALN